MSLTTKRPALRPWTRLVRAVRLAIGFLTVLPVRIDGEELEADDFASSRLAYPIVGLGIGLILAGLSRGLSLGGIAPGLSAFLLVAVWVLITGGLHLDGLADSCDGLFLVRGGAERRLGAMSDPHVGSFGATAIALILLGKYSTLVALADQRRTWAILGAAVIGRALVLVSAGLSPPARPGGLGRIIIAATTRRDAVAAAILVLLTGVACSGRMGLAAALAALVVVWLFSRLASARIGGATGDTLGAVVELGELAYLVAVGLRSH